MDEVEQDMGHLDVRLDGLEAPLGERATEREGREADAAAKRAEARNERASSQADRLEQEWAAQKESQRSGVIWRVLWGVCFFGLGSLFLWLRYPRSDSTPPD